MDGLGRFTLRQWPLLAGLISAAMLAIAHGFQDIGNLQPCTLCLHEREVYWTALAIAAAGFLLQRIKCRPWLVRSACIALAICFAIGTGIAVYHAGAEWKWWPGPQACSTAGAGAVTAAAMGDLLSGAHMQLPHCDEAAWIFLGLSMAGWNGAISLALTAVSIAAAVRRPWLAPPAPAIV